MFPLFHRGWDVRRDGLTVRGRRYLSPSDGKQNGVGCMQHVVCFTVGFKHDVYLHFLRLLVNASGHEKLQDRACLSLPLDARCNQGVRHGSHLHRLHTAEFAGSLSDTRNSGPFWQHCRRRAESNPGQPVSRYIGQVCRNHTHSRIHEREQEESQSSLQKAHEPSLLPIQNRTAKRSRRSEKTGSKAPLPTS